MRHTLKFIAFLYLLPISSNVCAQSLPIITSGSIEFEKTYNKFAIIQKGLIELKQNSMAAEFERYKTSSKQFLTLNSILTFSDQKTMFIPLPDKNTFSENRWNGAVFAEQTNTIFNDLTSNETSVKKNVLGKTYFINDRIRPIIWKITDETREIAGYTCRRANGLIMDSVYVVAFYTGEIPIKSGPESFSGLPGMILGVALPDENITWFATKVIPGGVVSVKRPPVKEKQMTFQETLETLKQAFQNYYIGGWNQLKKIML